MSSKLLSFWEWLWPLLLLLYLIGASMYFGYKIAKTDKPLYEHKSFIFDCTDCKASEQELTELEHEGWSVESIAGSDFNHVFLILKREISKSTYNE